MTKSRALAAIHPGEERKEGGCVLVCCVEDYLSSNDVQGISAIQGEEQVMGVCVQGGPECVPDTFGASRDTNA
jgi:hypothetical protein